MGFPLLIIFMLSLSAVPFLLTLINLILLSVPANNMRRKCVIITAELITMGFGGVMLGILVHRGSLDLWGWFSFLQGNFLLGNFLPTTCWVLIFLSIAVWAPLRIVQAAKMPRWLAIACVAVICSGFVPCLLLFGHFVSAYPLDFGEMALYFFLPPLNCVFIGAKAIQDYLQQKAVK